MIIIIFCIGLLLRNSTVARKVWLAALCVVTGCAVEASSAYWLV